MFKTKRLLLRAYDAELDDPFLLWTWNDVELQRATRTDYNIALGHDFIETIHGWVKKSISWVTLVEIADPNAMESGRIVGVCFVWFDGSPKNRDVSLAVTIAHPFWDKGYGSEAVLWMRDHVFRDLGMHRLSLAVFGDNARAIKVYERAGLIEEGRRKEAIWMNGKWEDNVLMGMTESRWRELANPPSG